MFSCSQDKKNDQTNDSIESTKVNTISENDVEEIDADEEMKQEIEIYEDLKIVTPDELTIDGYQRYFYNFPNHAKSHKLHPFLLEGLL